MDAGIANVLQKEQFNWISNVPIAVLKAMREENKLDYMRRVLRNGITDLKAKNDTDLTRVSEQLEKNIQEAFRRQESEIKSLEKQVESIDKKELPIVGGGFLAGFVPALSNAISILSAGRDVKNLLSQRKEAVRKKDDLENDFVTILMKTYDKDNTSN